MSERVRRSSTLSAISSAKALPFVALVVDLAVVALSGAFAIWGRESTGIFSSSVEIRSTLGVVGPLAMIGWIVVIYFNGGYQRDLFGAGTEEYKRIAHATLYSAALLGIGCYLTKFALSRGFFVVLFAVGVPALLLARFALRRVVHAARRRGARVAPRASLPRRTAC